VASGSWQPSRTDPDDDLVDVKSLSALDVVEIKSSGSWHNVGHRRRRIRFSRYVFLMMLVINQAFGTALASSWDNVGVIVGQRWRIFLVSQLDLVGTRGRLVVASVCFFLVGRVTYPLSCLLVAKRVFFRNRLRFVALRWLPSSSFTFVASSSVV
jgi:hypothetical protein